MNILKKHLLVILSAAGLTASAMAGPAIVVNQGNSESIDSATISSVLVGKQKFWKGGNEVIIAFLKGNASAGEALKTHAKMDEGRFKNHWQRLAFSGRGRMPKMFDDTASIVAFVQSNEGAIGVTDSSSDLSTVKVIN